MTTRDLAVLRFLSDFKVCRVSAISQLFFGGNLRVAQRRLKAMYDSKQIKRAMGREFVYYTKLPDEIEHALAVTDYLHYLALKHRVDDMRAEYECNHLQADALVRIDGKQHFIEVQRTGIPDLLKYLKLLNSKAWQSEFEQFPRVRLLSSVRPKDCGVDVVVDDMRAYSLAMRQIYADCTLGVRQ